MTVRLRTAIVCLFALAAGVLAMAPAGASASTTMKFGFSDGWEAHPAGIPDTAKLGADAARMFVCWCDVEPTPGNFNLGGYDYAYQQMLANGIRPMFVVLGSPPWARAGTTDMGRLTVPAPAFDANWQSLFATLTARYPRALGFEVWNEPNLPEFYPPKADPVRYTRLLQLAYLGVKSVDPAMPVVLGAPAGTDTAGAGPFGLSDEDFLKGVYANGGKSDFDVIGAHPYPGFGPVVGSMRLKLNDLRAVRDANGDGAKPIWVTETGVSNGGDERHPGFTEPIQAEALKRMWRALYNMPDVAVAMFNRWYDLPAPSSAWDRGMGVVRLDGSVKPSAQAFLDARSDPTEDLSTITLTPSSPTAERNQTIKWTASGWHGVGPVTFQWDLNGNNGFETDTGATDTASLKYTQPGTYNVAVKVSDFYESYNVTVPLTVGGARAPVALINLKDGSSYKLGRRIAFDGTKSHDVDASGKVVFWGWDIRRVDSKGKVLGKNNHYVGKSFAKALSLPGRYRVRLVVRDNTQTPSPAAQVFIHILKGAPPIPVISAPATAKAGKSILLNGSRSSDPDGRIRLFLWTIKGPHGYKARKSGPKPIIRLLKPGRYQVTLQVTDNTIQRRAARKTLVVLGGAKKKTK
jgi:hypothetical protein